MQELNIKHNRKIKKFAPSELTQERKRIIENKLQNALLRVLIENGGEVIWLKPPTTNKTKSEFLCVIS
jgi:hypothetical protein